MKASSKASRRQYRSANRLVRQRAQGGTLRGIRANRAVAGTALGTAALFMCIVAIMHGSGSLFYMATALIATILACRLQAWLSLKGLQFERIAPDRARVGDPVTVEITVWSDRKIRRPLITVRDNLPPRLVVDGPTPSLPVAPAYDFPTRTQYGFRPLKRGRYRWSGVVVEGTDALGLATMERVYPTEMVELTVTPLPIPVSVELPTSIGWGASEATSGNAKGAGLEPRGVREYAQGDSLRHVHWRSSARARTLLVKEFEAGSNTAAAFIIQRTDGTEVGDDANTSFELMVSHCLFLADNFLRQGAKVEFPSLAPASSRLSQRERMEEISELLTEIQPDRQETVGQEAAETAGQLPVGSTLFAMLAVQDPTLPSAMDSLRAQGTTVVALLYNGGSFAGGGRIKSATAPEYINRLVAAGIHPIIVPLEGRA